MGSYRFIDGIKEPNPVRGFNQAQRNALESAKGTALILEDDCILKNWHHLAMALIELPDDWDMVYLGGNIIGTDLCDWPIPVVYSEHLSIPKQIWTTHAIGYSAAGRKKILDSWVLNDQIYDDWLRENIVKMKVFIVNPMVADQRPGFSDIWNQGTAYGFFEPGNQRMKQ